MLRDDKIFLPILIPPLSYLILLSGSLSVTGIYEGKGSNRISFKRDDSSGLRLLTSLQQVAERVATGE